MMREREEKKEQEEVNIVLFECLIFCINKSLYSIEKIRNFIKREKGGRQKRSEKKKRKNRKRNASKKSKKDANTKSI